MKKLYIGLIATTMISVASLALAGPHFGKHGMHHPLEKMLDHVDLEDHQEQQIEEVLSRLEPKDPRKKGMKLFVEMAGLDPDSDNYDEQVALHADQAAAKVKAHIVAVSQARKDIYAILNDEQKAQLDRVIQKKLKRIAKRMERE